MAAGSEMKRFRKMLVQRPGLVSQSAQWTNQRPGAIDIPNTYVFGFLIVDSNYKVVTRKVIDKYGHGHGLPSKSDTNGSVVSG
ncbi:hypothetical protein P171DRAFT_437720 [Karstenula rhodostoma CBS 690.94]|uniref:Uncharacterized protein n=1 Tax=Karstenula rhodostoma CBS 690.94 TaxID=1392251 RepID=A0A9P4P712_9PLEO|nr:hypothetical protein P171DRAFT_437720 [Karstenula rhodostoma CBS 690.94]